MSKTIFLGLTVATLVAGTVALNARTIPLGVSALETPMRSAQSTPDFDTQEMLDAHNEWRSRVRSRADISPLVWSEDLADYASEWANTLADRGFQMQHRPAGDGYGENLYWGAGRSATPTDVVNSWGSEVENYNYNDNSCNGVCGHYTQIVWANTREVGCAVVRGTHPRYRTQEIWVCNYNPPGNYIGERPY